MAQFTVPTENELYSQATDPAEPGDIVQIIGTPAVEYDDADTITDWLASQNAFTFNSGNVNPGIGSVISGVTSGRTAVVVGVRTDSGTWGSNNVVGTVFYKSKSSATVFTPGENISTVTPLAADALTVITDTGNATDPTVSLDQTNMVEGLGCVLVTFSGAHSARCVVCYKSAGVDFTGAHNLMAYVRSSLTNSYYFGFGETNINDEAFLYACTGGDWETLTKNMSGVADANKDGVKMVAIFDASGSFTGGTLRVDRIYSPTAGVDKIKTNLLGNVVQLYPGRGSPVRPFKFPLFGGGTVDYTVSSDTTLGDSTIIMKVLEYDNITIEDGHFLKCHANDNALVILVRDTLTLGAGSYISVNYRGGAAGDNGTGGGAGAFGGGGGGGNATVVGGGGGGGGQDGEDNGQGGGNTGNNLNRGFYPFGIGRGGDGGAAATAGDPGVRSTRALYLYSLIPMSPEVAIMSMGGGGGGGAGATGGVGGRGSGSIWIEAKNIVWGAASYISANGEDGGQGALNMGGGGGGGGGCVVCIYESDTGSQTIYVTRGAAGAANGTGKAGAVGTGGIGQYIKLEAETLEQSTS